MEVRARDILCPSSQREHFVADVLSERYVGANTREALQEACQDNEFDQGVPGRPAAPCPNGSGDSKYASILAPLHYGGNSLKLPSHPAEVIDYLRHERYLRVETGKSRYLNTILKDLYYLARPLLPVGIRKYLQRLRASGWKNVAFPNWPVDTTVDNIFEALLAVALHGSGLERVPFIWFWPDGFSSCAILTHDVETNAGKLFCSPLMDMNDGYGIKSSFQIVPEQRYEVSPAWLNSIRERGFEVNVHDFNHDGKLFRDKPTFRRRAARINDYARAFQAGGFRSAVMYRNQDWLPALGFEYDMSVPNVAHLDPQHGGCCTVFPYFLDSLLELPLTTTQDYMLFHLLNRYSLDLWNEQIELILAKHGLLSFLVHPDYVIERRAQDTYERLLSRLTELREKENVWMALPGQAAHWWRQRNQMKLVERNGAWQVAGNGKERARIAYATLENDRVVYSVTKPVDQEAIAV